MYFNFLFYLIFLFFSLGQIGRVSLLNGQVNFYLYEVLMMVFFLSLFFKFRFIPFTIYYKKLKIFFVLCLFMIFSFFVNSLKYNFLENLVAFLYLKRLFFYFSYFIYLFYWVKKERKTKVLFGGAFIFVLVTLFTSLMQYFFYPDLRNLFYLGWDPHLYRMFGVFFDTGVAGAVFGMILIFLYQAKINSYFKYFLIIIFLIFLVLTFSRSVYLGFLLTSFFILFRQRKFKYLLVSIFLFGLLIFVVPKPNGEGVNLLRVFSINSRVKNYQQAIDLWRGNWLIGIGYNHIRYGRESFRIGNAGASYHSSFLIILVTGGVVGLVGWLGFLATLVRQNKKIASVILFLSILSLFDNILLHPFVLFLLLSVIPLL